MLELLEQSMSKGRKQKVRVAVLGTRPRSCYVVQQELERCGKSTSSV